MDFPVSSRFARTLGPKVVGTTTKFHVTWEDFHSLKNLPALEFEIFRTVAQGASCSIGDQLHPRGMLDAETYELVGKVYGQLKECKPSLDECVADVDIAGLHPEEFLGFELQKLPRATQGIMRMLSEGGHQFNIIDTTQSLEPYKLVILPDFIRVDAQFPLKEWGLNVASQGPRDDKMVATNTPTISTAWMLMMGKILKYLLILSCLISTVLTGTICRIFRHHQAENRARVPFSKRGI